MNNALFVTTAACILGTVATASAQNVEGSFQLGLGTDVLSYTKTNVTLKYAGLEQDDHGSTTHWGLSDDGGILVEGGYGLTNSLVFGALVALGGESTKAPEIGTAVDRSSFNLLLAPKLDYHFLAGQSFQPFIGGAIGLDVARQEEDGVKTSLMGLGLLVRGGGRWFLAPGFSLDPALLFGFQSVSGDVDVGAISPDMSVTGYTVGLSIGMSGWVR